MFPSERGDLATVGLGWLTRAAWMPVKLPDDRDIVGIEGQPARVGPIFQGLFFRPGVSRTARASPPFRLLKCLPQDLSPADRLISVRSRLVLWLEGPPFLSGSGSAILSLK